MDICLDDQAGLSRQSNFVQMKWTFDAENWETLWDSAMSSLSQQKN
jgi:hypothetical protein